jgi:hypothetical protein
MSAHRIPLQTAPLNLHFSFRPANFFFFASIQAMAITG